MIIRSEGYVQLARKIEQLCRKITVEPVEQLSRKIEQLCRKIEQIFRKIPVGPIETDPWGARGAICGP